MAVSVLLVRFLAFGDVLLTLPIIEALARSKNVSHVDLLTGTEYSADAIRSPWVREVYVDDMLAELGVYDVVADLHMRAVPLTTGHEDLIASVQAHRRIGYRSPHSPSLDAYTVATRARDEHAVECYARSVADLLDGPIGDNYGRIEITATERARATSRLPPRTVCLAPGARYRWKRWPAESYAKLADLLSAEGYTPILVGQKPFDEPCVRAVCELRETSVILDTTVELSKIMAAAGLVVANNSGLTALGSAAGARVVCVHSHTLATMWRPWGSGHVDLMGGAGTCSCVGPAPHDLETPCGKNIPAEDALEAVLRLSRGRI